MFSTNELFFQIHSLLESRLQKYNQEIHLLSQQEGLLNGYEKDIDRCKRDRERSSEAAESEKLDIQIKDIQEKISVLKKRNDILQDKSVKIKQYSSLVDALHV